MADTDLTWQPAWRLAELVRTRAVSAVEVVGAHLERIAGVEPSLHAFVTVAADAALARARAVDAAVQRGDRIGPLAGVPVAVKDEVWTKGIRSTGGSLLYGDFVPTTDATVVERLVAEGAVVIGKTQLPEFAMWPRSVNRVAPEARNPWGLDRISGASSGGSAAAVAAGCAPLAVSSDGGGSTRIPAALCGAIGLHPTPGSVPDDGTFSYSPFASLGVVGRDARDVALLYDVMSGAVAGGRAGTVTGLDSGVAGLRVAWTDDYGWVDVDPRVARVARAAVDRLAGAGAVVDEPGVRIDDIWPVFGLVTVGASRYGDRRPFVQSEENLARCRAQADLLTPGVGEALLAPPVPRPAYEQARAALEPALEQLRAVFAGYDVLCSPTMPTVAPAIPPGWDSPYPDEHMGTYFTAVTNVSRGTAATYPCGLVDGLPVGLHIAAPAGAEARVLQVCRALEQLVPWESRPPL